MDQNEQKVEPKKRNKKKINNQVYERELEKLQIELVRLQDWIQHKGLKLWLFLKVGMQQVRVA